MALFIDPTTGKMSQTQESGYVPFTGGAITDYQKPDTSENKKTNADLYSELNFETPEDKAFRESQAAASKLAAETPIDEATIRANTLAKFQSEIDALNRVYAEKKRVEQLAGQGRMGSVAAIGARRGLLGSDFGVAQERGQESANLEALNAIEAERMSKEAEIMSEARSMANAEIENKTAAKKLGAENYLAFIKESAERKKANATEIAKRLYEAGNYDTVDLKSIADALGISVETLKATYNSYKKTADAAKTKENIKLSPGESIYNPNTGKLEYSAPVEKKPIEMSAGGVLVDPVTGKVIFTAPDKPKNPLDYIKEIGGYIYTYNPETNTTSVQKSATETDQKIVKINGTDYVLNADGTYSTPKVPTIPSSEKAKRAGDLVAEIDAIINNPKLKNVTGPQAGNIPMFLRSGEGATLITNIDSLIANIATENLGMLKGPMSDKDIEFIKQASAGLSRNMAPEGFIQRLNKIKANLSNIKNIYDTEAIKEKATPQVQTMQSFISAHPEQAEKFKEILRGDPNLSDEEVIEILGFKTVGSDTNSATLTKAVSKPDGSKGGQCGRFVNNITGLQLGDSFQSKMAKMDPSIKQPAPGMVFTMPYKDTGHTGIIVAINNDGTATVKDSNYSLDEKVKTHKIPLSKMTGFRNV